jgi:outer membrane protein with beta-barrel domain
MTPRIRSILIASTLVPWLVGTPGAAFGEWLADLYLGGAWTQRHDVSLRGSADVKDVGFNTSSAFGGRIGYYFDSLKILGVALDVSHFRPDTVPGGLHRVDLYMSPISIDLMLRWPGLATTEIPRGRLQPYLTVGPSVALAEAKDTTNFNPPNQYDTNFPVGVKAGVGLAWQLYSHVALFSEFRYTHFSPEFTFKNQPPETTKLKTDINTGYFIAGFSLRF